MAAIIGIVVLLILIGLFYLLRSMGTMGQRPSTAERVSHTEPTQSGRGPRATGLD